MFSTNELVLDEHEPWLLPNLIQKNNNNLCWIIDPKLVAKIKASSRQHRRISSWAGNSQRILRQKPDNNKIKKMITQRFKNLLNKKYYEN